MVRKLATEHGLDLDTIAGTGSGGRITKQDVQAVDRRRRLAGSVHARRRRHPSPPRPPSFAHDPRRQRGAGAGEEIVPLTHIRKAIGDHMVASLADLSSCLDDGRGQRRPSGQAQGEGEGCLPGTAWRQAHVSAPGDAAPRTTLLAPSPWSMPSSAAMQLIVRKHVNMGIAVSYDQGLIVPVVRGRRRHERVPDRSAIADLAARARSHQLQPDDVAGATFTITNPGPYGSLAERADHQPTQRGHPVAGHDPAAAGRGRTTPSRSARWSTSP